MKFLSDIDVEQGADATFVDNAKALFGTGNDLQIYHDASNSYIDQTGTGKIILNTASTGINVQSGTGETRFTKSGADSEILIDDSSQINKVVLKANGDSYLIGGDVGIGTISPLSKLHINSGTSTIRTAVFESEGSSAKISFLDSANTAATGRENQVMIGSVGREMQFTTGGGIRMTLDMVGRLGLGPANSSPSEILDINGSIRVFEATNGGEIYIEGSTSSRKIVKLDNTSDKGLITLNRIDTTNVAISSDFTEHGHTYFNGLNTNLGVGNTSPSQKLHVTGNARVTGAYYDSNNSAGSNGQVLSSTNSGTTTAWVNASSGGSIGGSIADNQIAVGASTANSIEGSSDFTYTGSVFTVEGRMVLSDDFTTNAPNIYIGKDSGINSDLTGSPLPVNNIGIGYRALKQLTDGGNNIAIGAGALRAATSNGANIGIGGNALFYLDGIAGASAYNTVIGHSSGERYGASFTDLDFVTTGSDNVFVGWRTRPLANNPQNQIIIGYDAVGGGDNTITLGNDDIDTFRIPGLNATNNQVLTYNATAGGFKAAAAAGGGIGGATVATQVAFGAASSTTDITSSAEATFIENTGKTMLQVGSPGGKAQTLININQKNNNSSRARLELSKNSLTRGFLGIENDSTDVTLYSNVNLVLDSGAGNVIMTTQTASNVGVGNTSPTEKLDVTGRIKASMGVQVGAETNNSPTIADVGTFRYRTYSDTSFDYSAIDVCMQDGAGAGDYDWVNVVTKRW